ETFGAPVRRPVRSGPDARPGCEGPIHTAAPDGGARGSPRVAAPVGARRGAHRAPPRRTRAPRSRPGEDHMSTTVAPAGGPGSTPGHAPRRFEPRWQIARSVGIEAGSPTPARPPV